MNTRSKHVPCNDIFTICIDTKITARGGEYECKFTRRLDYILDGKVIICESYALFEVVHVHIDSVHYD